jgi:hypothetical protein
VIEVEGEQSPLDPALVLDPDVAFYILLRAREFDAKAEEVDEDEGSNPSDDREIDVLEFHTDDAVEEELTAAIDALNEDEKLDLIALAWIGRGDFELAEWAEAREAAREVDASQTAQYLLGMPTLSDYLQEALARLGLSLEDYLDVFLTTRVAPAVPAAPD